MPVILSDLFNENPDVEVIEVAGYDDGGYCGLSEQGRKLKFIDGDLARYLSELPGANSDIGHITDEGYSVHGEFNLLQDCYNALVYRLPLERRTLK